MDRTVSSRQPQYVAWTTDDVKSTIESSQIVVFAKGTEVKPRCGFTERVFSALKGCGKTFETINVEENPSIAAALRTYSGHRELPQVFVKGRWLACSDANQHLLELCDLKSKVEVELKRK